MIKYYEVITFSEKGVDETVHFSNFVEDEEFDDIGESEYILRAMIAGMDEGVIAEHREYTLDEKYQGMTAQQLREAGALQDYEVISTTAEDDGLEG